MTRNTEISDKGPKPLFLLLALLVGACAYALSMALPFPADVPKEAAWMAAGITGVVATCWLSGALPIGATSLMPLALMPLLGVLPIQTVGACYGHPIIWMFFGGFVLALGIERWDLHRRIALTIVRRAGVKPARLVLGFMVAAAFLSMWLSNTATTLLLLPIALAVIDSMQRAGGVEATGEHQFAFALLIGVAYGCSIGGLGTPIGTPPNGLFLSNYAPYEAAGAPPMTFLFWMVMAVPLVCVMLPLTWWLLTRVLAPLGSGAPAAKEVLDREARSLPPMDAAEKRMLALFALAALLWVTQRDVRLGDLGTLPGWWRLLPATQASHIGDGAVAVLVALLAFVLPSGRVKGAALMDWQTARTLPWDILFLFGGGIAIAKAFAATGLAKAIGLSLEPAVAYLPPVVMVLCVCLLMTFLTEVTSNTAVTALLLPVLGAAAVASHIDPRLLMLPATLSASCAFMLPIATPPNAIVFSSGRISMARMAKAGVVVNLLGAVLITLILWLVAMPLLGIDAEILPEWAQKAVDP